MLKSSASIAAFVSLMAASALVVCAAQPPAPPTGTDTGHQGGVSGGTAAAPQRAFTPPKVISAAPQVISPVPQVTPSASQGTSPAPQVTFAAPRAAPEAPKQTESATLQNASTEPPKEQVTINGYRRVVSNGQELFCRNDVIVGSHLKRKEVCRTQAQLEAEHENSVRWLQTEQRLSGVGGTPVIMGGAAPH